MRPPKARWSENRSIFNTPNPRLMNVSLLRDSKLLHGNEQRRGSRSSVRGPSRQPSMASLRPHSPTGSQGDKHWIPTKSPRNLPTCISSEIMEADWKSKDPGSFHVDG
uniref:Uncharacterized protein n=2 Tax=Timema TaxID=61471 RepID=A0A7R9GX27_TIMPO|nr:unnamed protein product [Timema douglasi]CAD7399427.1 unnamed protein product [Timema poppensis]